MCLKGGEETLQIWTEILITAPRFALKQIQNKHLLDDLEERSVKLGENLIAVFKLKANIVGLHPRYVLNKKRRTGRLLVTMQQTK